MQASSDPLAKPKVANGFRLGALKIEPSAGEAAGPGGTEKLDPKVMDVLVMLAERAGQVVLREDLLARIWPNVVVTDEALSRCIYELRRQLSLAAGGDEIRQLIETLPKRGYRLNGEIAPLSVDQPTSAARSRPRAMVLAAVALTVVVVAVVGYRVVRPPVGPVAAADLSIAVLPFADMSEGHDQGFFADGVTEEILNRLAQSKELRVIARTSSFTLRDRSLDVSEIARKFDVTHVLEGSIRKSGDRVRITAQLIAASNSSHIWSETFDRAPGDLFAIQDEIAASVATALQITLAGGRPRGRPPANAAAYESFLKGEYFYFRRSPGDIERSVTYFKQAIASDPNYARAWAALSGAYSQLAWAGPEADREMQRLQREAALRAVELDPGLAVAHLRLASFYEETSDTKKAEEHKRIATTLDPSDPLILGYLASDAVEKGDFDKAIAIQRRVAAQDPLNGVVHQLLAVYLLADEQFEAAISQFRSVLELNPDAGLDVEIDIVRILVLQEHVAEAYASLSKMPEGKYRDHGLALLYQVPAYRAESEAAYARLVAQRGVMNESIGSDIMDEVRLAEVQAFRGMNDEAFATLTRKKDALVRRWGKDTPAAWYLQQEAKLAPFLKPLHADSRWTIFTSPVE